MAYTNALFKISQVAKALSVSRATILRMEDSGLLRPAYTDRQSGYRYYDINNLFTIHQILLLRSFGFSTELIRAFMESPSDYNILISHLEERMQSMSRILDKMRMKTARIVPTIIISDSFPAVNCFQKHVTVKANHQSAAAAFHEALQEAMRLGLRLNLSATPYSQVDIDDLLRIRTHPDHRFSMTICLPVLEAAGNGIIRQPASEVLYFLWDGDPEALLKGIEKLKEEAVLRGLTPQGDLGIDPILPDFPSYDSPASLKEQNQFFRVGFPVKIIEH